MMIILFKDHGYQFLISGKDDFRKVAMVPELTAMGRIFYVACIIHGENLSILSLGRLFGKDEWKIVNGIGSQCFILLPAF